MKTNPSFTLTFDVILVPDEDLGGYTSFCRQFPNVITQGENEDEAIKNLMDALHDVLKHKSKNQKLPIGGDNIITKEVNFEAPAPSA